MDKAGETRRQRFRGPLTGAATRMQISVRLAKVSLALVAFALVCTILGGIPVVNLRRLAARLTGLTLRDLAPFESPHAALRFVHFIDRCYDFQVAVRVITDADPEAALPGRLLDGTIVGSREYDLVVRPLPAVDCG